MGDFIRSEKDIVLTLGVVGSGTETARIYRAGRDFQCINVSNDGVVQLGIDQDATTGRFLRKGMGGTLRPGTPDFAFLEFTNTSATLPQTITLQTSMGDIRDSRFNPTGGYLSVTDVGADGTVDNADQVIAPGASITIPANALRKAMLAFNWSAADNLRWGVAPDATHGMPIPPNSLQSIPLTGTFKIFNAGVAGVTVTLQELTKA